MGPVLFGKTSGTVSTGIDVIFFEQPAIQWSKALSINAWTKCFRFLAAIPGSTPSPAAGAAEPALAIGIHRNLLANLTH
jgi:hypothetical protein